MVNAIKGTTHPQGTSTIAEGIAVGQPGRLTRQIIAELVDDLVLVDEGDIEQAVLMLLEIEKTLVEGAGAAGLAALLKDPNVSPAARSAWCCAAATSTRCCWQAIIERGMVRAGRLARIRVGRARHIRACWRASPPSWPRPAPTSTRCTTSAPSRCCRRRTSRSNWCCRRATGHVAGRGGIDACKAAGFDGRGLLTGVSRRHRTRATFRRHAFRLVFLCDLLVLAPHGGWRGKRARQRRQAQTPETAGSPGGFCFVSPPKPRPGRSP
jgi:hypothetical protein